MDEFVIVTNAEKLDVWKEIRVVAKRKEQEIVAFRILRSATNTHKHEPCALRLITYLDIGID